MRRIIIFSFATLVGLVLSSCAVTKIHSVKTANLSSDIMQMPTVVEIEVADSREKSETFNWTNKLFSLERRIGIKDKTSEAIAQILEKSDADVLFEPHVSIDKKIGLFTQQYTLSVSGYPAKYHNFRTATIDDAKVINAINPPKQQRLKLAEFTQPQIAKLPASDRQTVAMAKAVTPKKERWIRQNGYMGLVDAGIIIPCRTYSNGRMSDRAGINVSTAHGALLAHRFFLGLGLGYNCQFYDYYYEDDSYYIDEPAHMINAFFNFRGYILKRRLSPFVDARVGVNTELSDSRIEATGYKNSFYWDAGIGLSLGKCFVSGYYGMIRKDDYFKVKLGVSF